MVLVVGDRGALGGFERAFLCEGGACLPFTIVPDAYGRGNTGVRAGTRVHPGSSSLIFSVVPDDQVELALAVVRSARDREGVGETTKIFVLPVEHME